MTAVRAASTVARSARSWLECSVYVKISPRPRNIAESKEVLRVLQQYGEVVMYRHLKYESPNPTPNAAVAIYRTENSANNAIDASPIRFKFKQTSDGWTSKISQDASSEGLDVMSSSASDALSDGVLDQSIRATPSQEVDNVFQQDKLQKEVESQAGHPIENTPEIEGNALIGPEKWEKGFLEPALQSETKAFGATKDTMEEDSTKNDGEVLEKKRVKKPAQRLAEDLNAALRNSVPKQENIRSEKPPAPIREFELTVVQSILNHQAHIERQAYYAGFNPDMKTIMAEDLKGRVPMAGLLDCNLNKPEVPLRVRLRRKEIARSPISLMKLWNRGKRDRGEI